MYTEWARTKKNLVILNYLLNMFFLNTLKVLFKKLKQKIVKS